MTHNAPLTENMAAGVQDTNSIRFRFDTHGLGDCCHCATVLQLYKARGYQVEIQVEANKRWLWEAAGIHLYNGSDSLPLHPFYYPAGEYDFWNLEAPDNRANKIANLIHGVDEAVLPRLGLTDAQLWNEICSTRLDVTSHVSDEAHQLADRFLAGMPRPIFAIHSRGTNWTSEKSIPDGTAFETILLLLRQTRGSVIVLDFDARAPSLAGHPRCKAILPDSGIDNLDRITALLTRLDLLIGIDSGPFHLAQLVPGLKSLGVFRKVPAVRCCIPSMSATYLVPGRYHVQWQRRLDAAVNLPRADPSMTAEPNWNFIEYRGDEPAAQEIADVAIELLLPPVIPPGASIDSMDEFDALMQSIPGDWLYRRRKSDERRLELKGDGSIGDGAAGCERKWRLIPCPGSQPRISIYGDANRETCRLTRGDDGIFRGHWNEHERMPIELIQMPDVITGWNLLDGRQALWTAEQAQVGMPGYDPNWNLPVGTRGNGCAWLLDANVPRSDLDSCGIDSKGQLTAYIDHEDWIYPYLDVDAGSVCLDLAAFIGTHSVWWARRGAIVIAAEPLPAHRDLLFKNLELNQVTDRVTVIPKAFADQSGYASMSASCGTASHLVSHGGKTQVAVTTIDIELLPHLSRLDLIKLDVEGAECDVIEGARETLQRFRPRLIIEVHAHFPGRERNCQILTEQLLGLGYQFRVIWSNTQDYYYLEATWFGTH